jgi:hypothetical protein
MPMKCNDCEASLRDLVKYESLLVLILEAAEECEDPAAWAKETAKKIRAAGIRPSRE